MYFPKKKFRFLFLYVNLNIALYFLFSIYVSSVVAVDTSESCKYKPDTNTQRDEEILLDLDVCKNARKIRCETKKQNSSCEVHPKRFFTTEAIVTANETKCIVSGNNSEWRHINFTIDVKRMKDGSRSVAHINEYQVGKCTLLYNCEEDTIASLRVQCYSYKYNADTTNSETNALTWASKDWIAPDNFTGGLDFSLAIGISDEQFAVDLQTARIIMKQSLSIEVNS